MAAVLFPGVSATIRDEPLSNQRRTFPERKRAVLPSPNRALVASDRTYFRSRSSPSAFPDMAVGSARASSFSRLVQRSLRYGLHTRAATVCRGTLTEGFNRFVTSTVAPVASAWSCRRVGLAPTGKAPPFHGARQKRALPYRSIDLPSTIDQRFGSRTPFQRGCRRTLGCAFQT